MPETPLLRSYLFVPASDPAKIQKAVATSADAVVVDLEDAVADRARAEARARLRAEGVPTTDGSPEIHLRISRSDGAPSVEDAQVGVGLGITSIRIPKVSAADEVAELASVLDSTRDAPTGVGLRLYPTIESALGVKNASEVAAASPLVARLVFGERDFLSDVGATSPLIADHARSELVLASRAAGIGGPVDGAYTHLENREGLVEAATRAFELGFSGKSAIHPNQIEVINQTFMPSKEEIENARKIVAGYETATDSGVGGIVIDGSFVDMAVVRQARAILERWG